MSSDNTPPIKPTTLKSHRFLLYLAVVILTGLLLWFWNFVFRDISYAAAPKWEQVEKSKDEKRLEELKKVLNQQEAALFQKVSELEQSQKMLRDSTNSTRDTMNQLLQNQKQLTDKNIPLSDAEKEVLAKSQKLFLENQEKYQTLNQEIIKQTAARQKVSQEITAVESQLDPLYERATKAQTKLAEKAAMKSAVLQLGILLPLFLLSFWLIVNKRNSTYGMLIYPFAISLFFKMSGVVHEYFPSRYFKYIALLAPIALVVAVIMYLVQIIKKPKPDLVMKEIRESYNKQVCPACAYPVQRTLAYRAGLRGKNAPRVIAMPSPDEATKIEPYSCPSCGTRVYEECSNCHHTRYSLLPYCEFCGDGSTTTSSLAQKPEPQV